MSPPSADQWTTLECLILAQAVYKHGEDSWTQVSRTLRQHQALKTRSPSLYVPQTCQNKYFALLKDLVGKDRVYEPSGNLADMPKVVKLARILHLQRINEIKELLKVDEIRFRELVREVEELKKGKWDDRFREQLKNREASERARQELAGENGETTDVVMAEAGPVASAGPDGGEIGIATGASAGEPTSGPDVSKDLETTDRMEEVGTGKPPSANDGEQSGKELTINTAVRDRSPEKPPLAPPGKEGSLSPRKRGRPPKLKIPAASEYDSTDGEDLTDAERRKSLKGDDKSRTWRKTSMMIWNKIADHRYGNVFLKPVKEKGYYSVVKQPMSLVDIKARIRDGIITTTTEFHRDILLSFTNALMFNNEDSNIYTMALEIKDYAEAEIRNLKYAVDQAKGTDTDGDSKMDDE
ncbi:Bromodomain-containing protein 8 [Borealophlyctis nickersoniae]|nr:Bromodomain-containing protein 8 [Borealophlyctis nickersoniae]